MKTAMSLSAYTHFPGDGDRIEKRRFGRLGYFGLISALLAVAIALVNLSPVVGQPLKPAVTEIAVYALQPGVDPAHLAIHDGKLYSSGFRAGCVSAMDLLS